MKVEFQHRVWLLDGPLAIREVMARVGADPRLTIAILRSEVASLDAVADDNDEVDIVERMCGG